MKKTISILTSLLITFSFTLSAQTVASNSDKKTNDTEYSKSEVKENKKSKGFNFFKSKKSAKNASCCASKNNSQASRNAAAKVRQAIAKGEITVEQGNARLARLQKGNKK